MLGDGWVGLAGGSAGLWWTDVGFDGTGKVGMRQRKMMGMGRTEMNPELVQIKPETGI